MGEGSAVGSFPGGSELKAQNVGQESQAETVQSMRSLCKFLAPKEDPQRVEQGEREGQEARTRSREALRVWILQFSGNPLWGGGFSRNMAWSDM